MVKIQSLALAKFLTSNNYFVSVADAAKQNINYSHKHFAEYLKHQCNNSIFIQPTDQPTEPTIQSTSYLLSTSINKKKILEKLMYKRVYNFLTESNITHALINLIENKKI